MAQYNAHNLQAGSPQLLTSTAKTIVNISAATATLRRAFIYEAIFGAAQVPNAVDCEIVWDFVRTNTSLGTGTAATPSPLDAADAAAGSVGTVNNTAEPTIGVSLDVIAINQRNSQRWLARDDKSRLVVPATNLNGISLRAKSSTYANIVLAAVKFDE